MKPLRMFVAISESMKYSRVKLDDIKMDSSIEVEINIVAGTALDSAQNSWASVDHHGFDPLSYWRRFPLK